VTSGLRFGVSAGTTRGFRTTEFEAIGHLISDVIEGLAGNRNDISMVEARVMEKVVRLTRQFPI
jgi:glycine hydroxymethyltransferase